MVSVSYFKTTGSRNRLELHLNKALKELNKHDDLCRPPSGGAGAGAALQDSAGAGTALQAAAPERLSAAAPGLRRGGSEDEGVDGGGMGGWAGRNGGF